MVGDNLMNIILMYKKIKIHIPTEKQIKLVSDNLLVDIIISDGLLFGLIRIHIVLDFVSRPCLVNLVGILFSVFILHIPFVY